MCLGSVPQAQAADPTAEYARQVSTAQLRLAQLELLLVEAELRIEQLEEGIRRQGRSEQSRLENIDQVNAEVTKLRNSIELLQRNVEDLTNVVTIEGERRQLHAEMRLKQIEEFLGIEPPPMPSDEDLGISAPVGGSSSRPTPMNGGGSEEDLPENVPTDGKGKLELAIEHMEAGRNGVARAILRSAVTDNSDDPLLDEIRYRIAETWFNEGNWRQAISEFNKVVNNHPESPWKCWAFLRMGEAFEAHGKPEGAKAFYKGAAERECRGSDAAKQAKSKL
ncbi:MAG: tetratricopeptide repeat protein [Myxococcales bacterium]|nr:tetratricopeptide repeat protein [Myxococcales bacterium]